MDMNELKAKFESMKRIAYPLAYETNKTEQLYKELRQIDLPQLENEEITEYKRILGKRKYETKDIKEEFTNIIEAIRIIHSKKSDTKLDNIMQYIKKYEEVLRKIEAEKDSKYTINTLKINMTILKPEITRFNAKYEAIIKDTEEYNEDKPITMK
jgi:hypothetical protein